MLPWVCWLHPKGHPWKYWDVNKRYCPRCGREEVCDLVTSTWREVW